MEKKYNKVLSALVGLFFILSFVSTAIAQDSDLDEDNQKVLTLENLPQPFMDKNYVYDDNTVIVVGDRALASDTLALVNIVSQFEDLAMASIDSVETEDVNGDKVLIQGVKEEVALGDYLNNTFGVISDNDLSFLQDNSIKYSGKKIDVEESIELSDKAVIVYSEKDKLELEDEIGLELGSDSVVYKLTFKDELRMDKDKASIDLTWLNKEIEIVNIDLDEVTIRTSTKYDLNVGESTTVDGKVVTLRNVGSDGAIIVDVDGEKEIIEDGLTKEVKGIEITAVSTFHETEKSERTAFLYIGEKVETTLEDGDCAELVGEINGDTECTWAYTIQTTGNLTDEYHFAENDFIGITFDENRNDYDEYLLEEDSLIIPGADGKDFAVIKVLGTNEPSYLTIDIEEEEIGVYELSGNDEEAFVFGSEEYRKVYLDTATNLFYEEYDLTGQIGDTTTQLILDDSELTINTNLVINTPTPLDLMNITPARDETVKTQYGIDIIGSEEWMKEFDELTLKIPEEQLLVEVIVGKKGSVSEEDSGFVPVDITVDTRLTSEVIDSHENNKLLIVGGPCAGNDETHESLIEKIFGVTCEEWSLTSGQALVKLSDNNLLIAGTDAIDTRKACKKVAESFEKDAMPIGTGTFKILEV